MDYQGNQGQVSQPSAGINPQVGMYNPQPQPQQWQSPQQQNTPPQQRKQLPAPQATKLLMAVMVAVLAIGGLTVSLNYGSKIGSSVYSGDVKGLSTGGNYQAVFFDNGQVYFGKIMKRDATEIILSEVYYLQVNQKATGQEMQASQESVENSLLDPSATPSQKEPELILLSRAESLHAPMDEMIINAEHVLFIEDMKDDSKVVSAIREIKNRGAQTQNQQP